MAVARLDARERRLMEGLASDAVGFIERHGDQRLRRVAGAFLPGKAEDDLLARRDRLELATRKAVAVFPACHMNTPLAARPEVRLEALDVKALGPPPAA